eukprot:gene10205-biopygen7120
MISFSGPRWAARRCKMVRGRAARRFDAQNGKIVKGVARCMHGHAAHMSAGGVHVYATRTALPERRGRVVSSRLSVRPFTVAPNLRPQRGWG